MILNQNSSALWPDACDYYMKNQCQSVCLRTFMIICHSSSNFSENKNLKISIICWAVVNISYHADWVGPLQRCSGQYFGNITYYINYHCLLYKHKWNTRWAFARKLAIFTCENNMLSSHVKISPLLWLHNKSRLSHQKNC